MGVGGEVVWGGGEREKKKKRRERRVGEENKIRESGGSKQGPNGPNRLHR
jgi:hypothetical protein